MDETIFSEPATGQNVGGGGRQFWWGAKEKDRGPGGRVTRFESDENATPREINPINNSKFSLPRMRIIRGD